MGLLNNIVGHERPRSVLLGSISLDRVATSYLFTGESGTGKRLTALEFAKAVNCLNPVEVSVTGLAGKTSGSVYSDACDICSSCRKISAGIHPDLRMIEPEGGLIKIDAIRDIQEFLSYKAHEGRRKVVIIDNAELMNQPASNAFLKTLEEPPKDSLIILVTMYHDLLLPTIRSRCFRVMFSPLNREESLRIIRENLPGLDNETLESLERISMGRPGLVISEDRIKQGSIDNLEHDLSDLQWKDRTGMEEWFNRLIIILRDLMVLKIAPSAKGLLVRRSTDRSIKSILRSTELREIIEVYNDVLDLRRYFRFNLNASIVSNYITSLLNVRLGINLKK
jgi:DNA polymerase-3 subunit delta'